MIRKATPVSKSLFNPFLKENSKMSVTRDNCKILRCVPALLLVMLMSGASLAAPITVPNHSWENSTNLQDQWILSIITDGQDSLTHGVLTDGGAHGNNYVRLQTAYWQTKQLTSAASLGSMVEGMEYTLTVALRDTATGSAPYTARLRILGDDAALATTTLSGGNAISTGSWSDYTVSYTALAADAGKALKVRIEGFTNYHTNDWHSLYIDNVRLDAIPV